MVANVHQVHGLSTIDNLKVGKCVHSMYPMVTRYTLCTKHMLKFCLTNVQLLMINACINAGCIMNSCCSHKQMITMTECDKFTLNRSSVKEC